MFISILFQLKCRYYVQLTESFDTDRHASTYIKSEILNFLKVTIKRMLTEMKKEGNQRGEMG